MKIEIKRRLTTPFKKCVSKLASIKKISKPHFSQPTKHLILLSLFMLGIVILLWIGMFTLNDISVWNKDLNTALFGSRTGESVSLGMGMILINYVVIGCALLAPAVVFFLRNYVLHANFWQAMLIRMQKVRNKNPIKNRTKKAKSRSKPKTKDFVSVKTAKLKVSNNRIKPKLSVIPQSFSKLKAKMISGLGPATHSISIHVTKKRKQTIVILFVSVVSIINVFFLTTISGQLFVKTNVYSYGSIQVQTIGVAVYRDASCNIPSSQLAWGSLVPGSFRTNTVYIRNEGAAPLTLLLDAVNWSPPTAPDYMSLSWNYDGQTIEPGEIIQVTLKLTVSEDINGINSFNFEIIINGTS